MSDCKLSWDNIDACYPVIGSDATPQQLDFNRKELYDRNFSSDRSDFYTFGSHPL